MVWLRLRMRRKATEIVFAVLAVLALGCSSNGSDDVADGATDAPGSQDLGSGGDGADDALVDAASSDMGGDDHGAPVGCAEGSRMGATGKTDGLTASGVKFNVRVPTKYVPTEGSPLIVVFAFAGGTAASMESATALTTPATARGFIVAYANHISPATPATGDQGHAVVKAIMDRWCVDPARVHLTGHSDGATLVTLRMAFRISGPPEAATVAPSATGWTPKASDVCPPWGPLPAMVIHNKDDTLFPGYGLKVRDYFVRCNTCDKTPGEPRADGCRPYVGCKEGSEVLYCEKPGAHGVWQKSLNPSLLDFFEAHHR